MDELSAEATHDLLLALAGRVDDDLLAWARELVAVGERQHAVELLTATLAADRAALPQPVRAALVGLARSVRTELDVDAALPPGTGEDGTAHRFDPTPDEAARGALLALPARQLQGCRVLLTRRLTPAGAAPGPLPHAVVVVEVEPDARPRDVLAYQLAVALERAGVRASVEVVTVDGDLPAYHVAALRDARPVRSDVAGEPARAVAAGPDTSTPVPAAPVPPAPVPEASSREAPVPAAPVHAAPVAEAALPAPRPVPRPVAAERAPRPGDAPAGRSGRPGDPPAARHRHFTDGLARASAARVPPAPEPSSPEPSAPGSAVTPSAVIPPAVTESMSTESMSTESVSTESVSAESVSTESVSSELPAPEPPEAAHPRATAATPLSVHDLGLRPESVARLSPDDRQLLARLQAELLEGRRRPGAEADAAGTRNGTGPHRRVGPPDLAG